MAKVRLEIRKRYLNNDSSHFKAETDEAFIDEVLWSYLKQVFIRMTAQQWIGSWFELRNLVKINSVHENRYYSSDI